MFDKLKENWTTKKGSIAGPILGFGIGFFLAAVLWNIKEGKELMTMDKAVWLFVTWISVSIIVTILELYRRRKYNLK